AEDGIRDFHVTGVQTCALPIYVGGVNIVVPDNVKASVTVRLRDVPWDQAMEVILQSKGLWYRREGNLIRVADRKVLDAEDKEERSEERRVGKELRGRGCGDQYK